MGRFYFSIYSKTMGIWALEPKKFGFYAPEILWYRWDARLKPIYKIPAAKYYEFEVNLIAFIGTYLELSSRVNNSVQVYALFNIILPLFPQLAIT